MGDSGVRWIRKAQCFLPALEASYQQDTYAHSLPEISAMLSGLADTLRVEDKTIQAILRHSTLALTMNVYVKTVGESQTNALDSLSAEMCNASATETIQ